jgi:hypothetical protein
MALIDDAEKIAALLESLVPVELDGQQVVLLEAAAARELAKRLRDGATAQKRVRFIPRGADEPLPPLPGAETITEADIQRSVQAWKGGVPEEFGGLLEAE